MQPVGSHLFVRPDRASLHMWLEAYARQEIAKAVDALPDGAFGTRTNEELAIQIAGDLAVAPLVVAWDHAEREVTEHTIREQDSFGRGMMQRKGLRGVKKYSYTGPSVLWQLLPSTYSSNLPQAQISGQFLIIGVEMNEQEANQAPAFLDAQVGSIKVYLERQGSDLAAFNSSLPNRIHPYIQERRARLNKAAELLKRL